ncbi:elongation factor G [Nocardia transvalensis]|uniref:elongation factor G n=1 Tax=Nocardia transvalensis TaxID=37333 RepID=UPI00189545CB|nr:TetM/TetW/TetO/TetS family tetracycline resistance ribosomal protection protein [Nocardia transvalensis]MBF6327027.1 TetM/TetW/TetO/TetS family tetracycline resistance ribosomal protection protein [Nocardia transvalensis]
MQTHPTLTIGILAHVDAGKTSLTERLLFDCGAIDSLGSVDSGTTRTDTGTIERQRGITVRPAVVSFTVGSTQVNIIDTPGHSDFVAEVDRALEVLDAAVLVVSAVEGVQAQTRVLMRILRDMRLPVLIFVNKIDRPGARGHGLLPEIRRRLAPHAFVADSVSRTELTELLADLDDTLLERIVAGVEPTAAQLESALVDQVGRGAVHPVYFGSARTGQGIDALLQGITSLRPRGLADTEPDRHRASGIVFAVERSPSGTKTAYLRLFRGTVEARREVTLHRREHDGELRRYTGRITSLEVVGRTGPDARRLTAGNIGRITGPTQVRVGDRLGDDAPVTTDADRRFPMPTLRSLVRPRHGSAARLHAALQQMAEHDPLLHVRAESEGATSVLLYGEIQRQIVAATLADEFGIDADFEPSQPICLERVVGVGEACEEMGRRAPSPSGFWATVGLRIEPAPADSGVSFRHETELGALPHAFHCAIEESVRGTLRRGPRGRTVTDCLVTLTRSGFAGPVTTAADFRGLTPLVLERALDRAGTQVFEPCHAVEVEVPADAFAAVTALLTGLGGRLSHTAASDSAWWIEAVVPARHIYTAQQRLPGLTRGEGTWWSRPSGYLPAGREAVSSIHGE